MIARFRHDQRGSPSAEFVLILPALMALMFGGFEAGHFVWTQHKLIKAVREGARYAARLPVDSFCDGADADFDSAAESDIKSVTVTGRLPADAGSAAVPGLTADNVIVAPACAAYVDTGIYSDLGVAGPVVTVSVSGVGYPSLFAQMTGLDGGVTMAAKASAPVIGL